MSSLHKLTVFLLSVLLLLRLSASQSCNSLTFSNSRTFQSCNSLARLSSSLHWTYTPATGAISLAFRAAQSSNGWISWGINPTGTMMVGTQALVALRASNGSMVAYTAPVAKRQPDMTPATVSVGVRSLAAEFSDGVMTIFATVELPNNRTTFNHVWQSSTEVSNGVPAGHPLSGDNIMSYGSVDFLSGAVGAASNSKLVRRNVHGVLNAVSWGVLMPIGAIIARYMRVFPSADPAWFYLHITCQCSAYILGVAGWGTGLKLGSESQGITYHRHRYIGITLFCLATLQVFALLLRPHKDHKHRIFWNVYHHSVGYTVIILGCVNIFKGFNILVPDKKWKNAYIAIICTLAAIASILEIVTWIVVLRRKSKNKSQQATQYERQTPKP